MEFIQKKCEKVLPIEELFLPLHQENKKSIANAIEDAKKMDKEFWETRMKMDFYLDNITDEQYDKLLPSVKNNYIYRDNETEVAYFRKVNFLLPYFGYEENLSDLEVCKEKIEALVADCERELNHEDVLTPQGGFFFGNTAKDEFFYSSVKNVRDTFANILKETDWENEIIVMSCWW